MVPEILDLVLRPFDFFINIVHNNLFSFMDGVLILIILNAVYRFLLSPILGGGSGSSDLVKKEKKKN